MISYRHIHIVLVCLIILLTSCFQDKKQLGGSPNERGVLEPKPTDQLKKITIISPPDTVELINQGVFESSDEIFMDGYINELGIDDQNRVYIVVTKPGAVGVYVFNPDGSYKTRFASLGKGPGEYESISSIDINGGYFYLLDSRLQKMGVFSLRDFSHVNDELIKREEIKKKDSLITMLGAHQLFSKKDGSFILSMRKLMGRRESDIPYRFFYQLARDGTLLQGSVLKVRRFPFYYPKNKRAVQFPMPFTRSSLVSMTESGHFFTVWTEEFLIKEYDAKGNYRHAFHLPYKNSLLNMDELRIRKGNRKTLEQYEMPETWPAIHTMELDDKGRLWVASITDSDSTYQWRVINQQGDVIARFTREGYRASRSVISKPIIAIKNGYFYSHKRNFSTGVDRIIKQKIFFKSRD